MEPLATVTDTGHPLVGTLVERQHRWHDRFRHTEERAAHEAARARVLDLLPATRLLELPDGFLWLGGDGERTHVHDVDCPAADVDAVRELATGLAGSPLSVSRVPGEALLEAFAGDGTFHAASATMRLDLAREVPGEQLAGRVDLAPMTAPELAAFRALAAATYAEERERAGESRELARERARASFDDLLPDGTATAGQHLLTARHDGEECGVLWVADRWTDQAWIYDVELLPAQRGRGLGAALLARAAVEARRRGHGWLGLNVFAHNEHARDLYGRLGYVVEEEFVQRDRSGA